MRSYTIPCAMLTLVLGVASAVACDNQTTASQMPPTKDITVAGKIIGNGRAPDSSGCKDAKNSTGCENSATSATAAAAALVEPASATVTISQPK